MTSDPRDHVCIALDLPWKAARPLVDRLGDDAHWYKVGMTLFFESGVESIQALVDRGKNVFLDLKLCDIPAQVAGGVEAFCGLGIRLLTVHAWGGRDMVTAAVEATTDDGMLEIVAVTVLTSVSSRDLERMTGIDDVVVTTEHLAREALDGGVKGIVCSGHELPQLRKQVGDFFAVVPGIRGSEATPDDQRRTVSAAYARSVGADLMVVGRPITGSSDPKRALETLYEQLR